MLTSASKCGDVYVRLTESTTLTAALKQHTKERQACKDNKSATLTAKVLLLRMDGWMDRWMKNDSVADSPSTE